ncbi:MAG: Nucleosomal histone H3-Lys79 methylase [Trichoglossum hirsutum]|nr:MAG: Nucleosomal histone H3-Lys79 methylase [Trichoglossum hirsutum]
MGFFDHFHKDGTAALKAQAPRTRKEVVKLAPPLSTSSISPVRKHRRNAAPAHPKTSDVQLRDTTSSRQPVADGKQEKVRRVRKRASPLQNRLASSSDNSDSEEAEVQLRKRIKPDGVGEKCLARNLRYQNALTKDDNSKFTFLHAADIAALGPTNNNKAAFGNSSELEISLQYPGGPHQERYQLVHPRDNEDFNPVDDLIRVIELVSTFYLPSKQAKPLLDENSGIIRKLRRALARGSGQEFREGVLRYNQIIKDFRDNGTVSRNLDKVHSLPLPLIERILTQTYARTVSLQVSALKKYENGSDNVYGELLPRFISKIFLDTRIRSDQVFVDLGSGVGNVVLQAALEVGCESWGCEMMENACELAERQEKEFTARCRLWGLAIGDLKLERGDFLKNHNIPKILRRADVVLVNNQAFTPELNNGLVNLFLDLREGCQIVSLKSFVPHDHKITSRNVNSPVHLLNVERKEYFSDSVSWTNAPGTYFVARKDSTKLKEFQDRMGQGFRRSEDRGGRSQGAASG